MTEVNAIKLVINGQQRMNIEKLSSETNENHWSILREREATISIYLRIFMN